ncbi:MAG: hypothetical protein HY814_14865 [Candidatus Riflebacteria bacterium]|nr:hypothetical protein [Candidatus Riflebacteria bacterium]
MIHRMIPPSALLVLTVLFLAASTALVAQSLPEGHPPIGGGTPPAAAPAQAPQPGSGSEVSSPAPAPAPGSGSMLDAPAEKAATLSKEGMLEVGPLQFKAPSSWTFEPTASPMRKAQFRLPKGKDESEGSEVVLSYFGPQAGSVDANITRWCEQFEQPDGSPSEKAVKRESLKAGTLDVTLIALSGNMKGSQMPGAEAPTKANHKLLAAIVETPQGPWFVKAAGPVQAIEQAAKDFREFVLSAKLK